MIKASQNSKSCSPSVDGQNESSQDNFSKTIYVIASNLAAYTGTLEEKISQYVNSLNYEKQDTDADIWVEYDDESISLATTTFYYQSYWTVAQTNSSPADRTAFVDYFDSLGALQRVSILPFESGCQSFTASSIYQATACQPCTI